MAEGIRLSQETRDLANLAYFLETLAVVEFREGDHSVVPSLLGSAAGLRETVGASVYGYYLPDEAVRETSESGSRAALGDQTFEEQFENGRRLGVQGVIPSR